MKFGYLVAGSAAFGVSFLGQGVTSPELKGHIAALQSAQSLTITFSVTRLPAAPEEYTLSYSKPNKLRIESPSKLIISDGTKLYVLDKSSNTYTEATANLLASAGDEVFAWAAFFDPKSFANALKVESGAKRKIKGKSVTEVILRMPGDRVATLYVDDKTGVARGGSMKSPAGDHSDEVLALSETMMLGKEPLTDSEFAFTPPAGAKLQEAPKVELVRYASVQAIFDRSCVGCHGSSGGLSLGSYQSLMAGGNRGAVIVPGKPDESRLIQYIKGTRSPRMPKNAPPLSASDTKLVSDWIAGGAKND